MRSDIEQGVCAELDHILRPDWKYSANDGGFIVNVPASESDPDLRAEIWRIANFIAYGEFASISRLPEGNYRFVTRDSMGAGFTILFSKQTVVTST